MVEAVSDYVVHVSTSVTSPWRQGPCFSGRVNVHGNSHRRSRRRRFRDHWKGRSRRQSCYGQRWGSGGDGLRQCKRDGARHRLESLIGKVHLVDPPSCSVPRVGVGVGRSSIWHSGNLVLNAQPETSSKFHHQCPGVRVSCVGDQGLEVV